MQMPPYQHKLERMVPDQKGILVGAAFGDRRVWESLTDLYRFEETDQSALRAYIRRTYLADGTPIPIADDDGSGTPAKASD